MSVTKVSLNKPDNTAILVLNKGSSSKTSKTALSNNEETPSANTFPRKLLYSKTSQSSLKTNRVKLHLIGRSSKNSASYKQLFAKLEEFGKLVRLDLQKKEFGSFSQSGTATFENSQTAFVLIQLQMFSLGNLKVRVFAHSKRGKKNKNS